MKQGSRQTVALVSVFSGAGGLDFGFESQGDFVTTLRIEAEPVYCTTLESATTAGHLQDAPVSCTDFRTLSPKRLPSIKGSHLGIIGGPPCESFSSFGLRRGRTDPRSQLILDYATWIKDSRADFFVLENVPFLCRGQNKPLFEELRSILVSGGFRLTHKILNAADYGAATLRQRLFVIGVRSGAEPSLPTATHGSRANESQLACWVTAGKALDSLPAPSKSWPGVPQGHVGIRHTAPVVERFRRLTPGEYDRTRRRFRLEWDQPSPSLVAGNHEGIRSHIHPLEPRELTNRESARIQGFPDDYQFVGTRSAAGKQIANAVPIPLAQAVASHLSKTLN